MCTVVFLEVDLVPHLAQSFSRPLAFKEEFAQECWDNQITVEQLIYLCYPPAADVASSPAYMLGPAW